MAQNPSSDIFKSQKRWQIALRRYTLHMNMCVTYAPYFGLDNKNMRKWIELQFNDDIGWSDFGKKWQFGHVLSIKYFDLSREQDLKLCWNFLNIKIFDITNRNESKKQFELFEARKYFAELYKETSYPLCKNFMGKIDSIMAEFSEVEKQKNFILQNIEFLKFIENYSEFEFELLNTGRNPAEVRKDIAFMKKIDNLL